MKKMLKKWGPFVLAAAAGVILANEAAPWYVRAKNEVKKLAGRA